MNHIRNVFVHPLSQLLTLLTWTFIMVSDFYRLRVWLRHLVLLGCSCPAPSQTRSQAPEYAKWPKMAYSARNMPQSYILLLRPYFARNSASRMCKGLAVTKAWYMYIYSTRSAYKILWFLLSNFFCILCIQDFSIWNLISVFTWCSPPFLPKKTLSAVSSV